MRILLSAYACEPGKGSEPGVGWNWAIELGRRGHEVTVLTRKHNRDSIEKAQGSGVVPESVRFAYYDLPERWSRFKKGRRGIHFYYFLWQAGATRFARRLHAAEAFDLVHHVTFVVIRQPSFMGMLGIPFVLGPVSGGERIPLALRTRFPFRAWCAEWLRDVADATARIDPLVRASFDRASRIYVTSERARRMVPVRYRARTETRLAIGLSESEIATAAARERPGIETRRWRALFVGNLLDWKGLELALTAFAAASKAHDRLRLTVVGSGPDRARWKSLARDLGVDSKVTWLDWMSRDRLADVYASHQALLFPSLRDSGGMVVLEAMAHGLPVVCLDAGGPGRIVDDRSGIRIPTHRMSHSQVVGALESALVRLAFDAASVHKLSEGARARVRRFTWASLAASVYEPIENAHRVGCLSSSAPEVPARAAPSTASDEAG